jgi:hypothetical protein
MEEKENFKKKTKKIVSNITQKSKDTIGTVQQGLTKTMDRNGDGKIDIEDIIIISLGIPGIRINRAEFLQKELQRYCTQEEISNAIEHNLTYAKISNEIIDKIADQVIKYERNCVSGISTALSMPGGFAMAATIPTDIAQYYGYMLRATQKLMYLYGFPEIDTSEKNGTFDSETVNTLTICLGVMYGVAGANSALRAMATGLANGISKKIMSTALTKGTLYPIVKNIAKWFGVKMTKKMLVGVVQKTVPVIGGVVGGGITFVTFKPCCDKLKKALQNTSLSNPNYVPSKDDIIVINDVDDKECIKN